MIKWQQNKSFYLNDKNIDIWYFDVSSFISKIDDFFDIIDAQEKKAAKQFVFEKDYKLYVASHGILRILLGNYLKQQPKSVIYKYNDFGKPFVEFSDIQFNLSHNSTKILIGITLNYNIGVDVEFVKEMHDHDSIVRRFFSKKEQEEFFEYLKEQRNQIFYLGWTRKEAFIKALGKGLSFPLKDFDVTLSPEKKSEILSIFGNKELAKTWNLESFLLEENCYGAVAWEGMQKQLCFFKDYNLYL
jgi:4'-phosphopantetheinyl transferase